MSHGDKKATPGEHQPGEAAVVNATKRTVAQERSSAKGAPAKIDDRKENQKAPRKKNTRRKKKAGKREVKKGPRVYRLCADLDEATGGNRFTEYLEGLEPDGRVILEALAMGASKGKQSMATQIVKLVSDVGFHLWHDPKKTGYMTTDTGAHWPLRSTEAQRILAHLYYENSEPSQVPNRQALDAALTVLEGKARFEGEEHTAHIRVASAKGKIYVDLCDDSWRAVEIDKRGFRIRASNDLPVRFIRRQGMLPLPEPAIGGSIHDLRDVLPTMDDDAWALIVAWMVAALRPGRPFAILVIEGEQGSGKTVTCRILRFFIDPSAVPLRRPPRCDRDLAIACSNSWVVGYDNLSKIPGYLSDALCCVASGGGFATRQLYTDADEALFDFQRPIVVNGITTLATRPDLADRSILVRLASIDPSERCTEAELDRKLEEILPRVLAGLFLGVSMALARVGDTKLQTKDRLADFQTWAEAAASAFGWEQGYISELYTKNREEVVETALADHPVAVALRRFMEARSSWKGTATALHDDLTDTIGENATSMTGWPKSAAALSNALRRLIPGLRETGIGVTMTRDRKGSQIDVERVEKDRHNSHTVTDQPDTEGDGDDVTPVTMIPGLVSNDRGVS